MERKEDKQNVTMQERVKVDWNEIRDDLAETDLKELSNSRNGPVFH